MDLHEEKPCEAGPSDELAYEVKCRLIERSIIEVSASTIFQGNIFSPRYIEHLNGDFFIMHDRVSLSIVAISEEKNVIAALFVADFSRELEAKLMGCYDLNDKNIDENTS